MMKAWVFLALLVVAAVAEADNEPSTEPAATEEFAERAVFEVGKGLTNGFGGARWKMLASRLKGGLLGPRVTAIKTRGDTPPTIVFYDAKGLEMWREDISGLGFTAAIEVLKEYGFDEGDTRQPTPESLPENVAHAQQTGGSCGNLPQPSQPPSLADLLIQKQDSTAQNKAPQQQQQEAQNQQQAQNPDHSPAGLALKAAAAAEAAAKAAAAAAAVAEAAAAAARAAAAGGCSCTAAL